MTAFFWRFPRWVHLLVLLVTGHALVGHRNCCGCRGVVIRWERVPRWP